jgi:flagellar biosynthesis/type III secretory pathway chaperone
MIINSIERLEETIDAETAALLSHSFGDQQEFNRRKSQSLLELSRLARGLRKDAVTPELARRLQRLRDKLEINNSVLEMNLRAVQEVADIVSKAIQSSESDGTYSAVGHY